MKVLLVAEYRDGKVLGSISDLLGFAARTGADHAMFVVGSEAALPTYGGTLYLADAETYGEYQPAVHKQLLLTVIDKVKPDLVVFSHSSYGWDLAPRVAYALGLAQVSEVVDYVDGTLVVPVCNAKLRRTVEIKTGGAVVTLQAGAFGGSEPETDAPTVERVTVEATDRVEFLGYEAAEAGGIDLSKAEVIVSAGRGIGKPENISLIADLAKAFGGEYGASRPVVDAEWAEHDRQVGTTGQSVAPKLYIACGISGAIQHLAGMKKSDFIVAINTDRDAPIGDVADVLAVADLTKLVPVLIEKLTAS
jgi:electron transfer flavoprotein alpha subunit